MDRTLESFGSLNPVYTLCVVRQDWVCVADQTRFCLYLSFIQQQTWKLTRAMFVLRIIFLLEFRYEEKSAHSSTLKSQGTLKNKIPFLCLTNILTSNPKVMVLRKQRE